MGVRSQCINLPELSTLNNDKGFTNVYDCDVWCCSFCDLLSQARLTTRSILCLLHFSNMQFHIIQCNHVQ